MQTCGIENDTCGGVVTKSSRNLPCCEGYMCTYSNATKIDFESVHGVCEWYKAKENLKGRIYNKQHTQKLLFLAKIKLRKDLT